MTFRDRFLVRLQYLMGRMAAFLTVPALFLAIRLMGYRIRNLKQVRHEVADLHREYQGPWLVCPNHLTMIDSALISYGMMSISGHILGFRKVPWNLPERDNFQRSPFLALLCYLVKCLPVNRGGSREELQRVIEKCRFILGKGQNLMIFPEGGRSRSGRVDRKNYSYGVGRFIDNCPRIRVMLVYFRGDGQRGYGKMPRYGERFTMTVEPFDPGREAVGGLRLQREYAKRIVERLAVLEEVCLASRG